MNSQALPRVKDRVPEDRKRAVLKQVASLAPGNERIALALYGSRVAGYAKANSDYDIILVLKDYRHRARYFYVEGDISASALLVDSVALEKDASKAFLGEFVVGRLLNVYDPLLGEEFLQGVERTYKRRVAMEILAEVVAAHSDFSSELQIPTEYFLFEKLRKRAAIYPPALYSYAKTYSGPLMDENISFAVEGFVEAFGEMQSEGLVALADGYVKLLEHSITSGQLAKLSHLMTDTARGLAQYAVHGYAGRVGWKVVGKEALSKIRRNREVGKIPLALKNPKQGWRLKEGMLIVESGNWLKNVLENLGYDPNTPVETDQLGELYNVAKMYLVNDGEKPVSFAVKHFKDLRSFKWALLNVWAIGAKRFNMSPLARMHREYRASLDLRDMGINTPEVVAVVLNDRIMVTRFIEGESLGHIASQVIRGKAKNPQPIASYGETLARVHGNGYSLGDTKPSNAIYANDEIFLTDLEQASTKGDRSWDIAEFIYFSCKMTPYATGTRALTRAFLKGYLKHGDREAVRKALDLRYLAPFQPFMVPNVSKAVRDEAKKVLTELTST
ncbi:MAG: hypothetical protein HYU39_07945 [Thaumarchaeota archaeon]|nr:hypothetical protein [Nitrososphaerota archaeon]